MATISTLKRYHIQPDLEVNGNSVEVNETWILKTNTRTSTAGVRLLINALTASNSYGWPIIGDEDDGQHEDDSSLVATTYNIARDEEAGFIFMLSVFYTNDINTIAKSQNQSDSSNGYDYQEVTVMEEVDFDPIQEKQISASSGEGVWPKLQRPRTLDRIIVTRNQSRYRPSDLKRYRNKVNSSSMNIDGYNYETRSLRMESITGKRQIDPDGEEYYIVRYALLYDPDQLHQKPLIDIGNGPDVNGTHPQIVGAKWNKPRKLDGSGAYMSKARQQDPTDYVTNTWNIYPEVAMNHLRL